MRLLTSSYKSWISLLPWYSKLKEGVQAVNCILCMLACFSACVCIYDWHESLVVILTMYLPHIYHCTHDRIVPTINCVRPNYHFIEASSSFIARCGCRIRAIKLSNSSYFECITILDLNKHWNNRLHKQVGWVFKHAREWGGYRAGIWTVTHPGWVFEPSRTWGVYCLF